MKIPHWACLAAVVCLAVPAELAAQARVGGRGGFGRGGISAGGARGGSVGGGVRGGGLRGMPRGRSAGSITGRGLPSVQGVPTGAQRSASGRGRGSSRGARPAVVGAGGFRGTDRVLLNPPRGHGNVIAPGTPGRFNPGNPIAPGTPNIPGTTRHRAFGRHTAHPKVQSFGRHFGHGHQLGVPIVYVPYGYGYGYSEYIREDYVEDDYLEQEEELEERIPNVIYVDPSGRTVSSSEYVIQVQPDEPPASGTIFEVRPTGSPGPPPVREGSREEVEAEPAAQRDQAESTLYLIALKDGAIYTSREHWLQGDTLHYVTREGVHNLVSISQVDTALTVQLNSERGLSFVLEVRADEQ